MNGFIFLPESTRTQTHVLLVPNVYLGLLPFGMLLLLFRKVFVLIYSYFIPEYAFRSFLPNRPFI